MSDAEKALQTLAAINEYQQAKAEDAHIEMKLKRFYEACRQMGRNAEGCTGLEPRIVGGIVEAFRCDLADLMNAGELRALLAEQEKARARLAKALEAKNTFGIILS